MDPCSIDKRRNAIRVMFVRDDLEYRNSDDECKKDT